MVIRGGEEGGMSEVVQRDGDAVEGRRMKGGEEQRGERDTFNALKFEGV